MNAREGHTECRIAAAIRMGGIFGWSEIFEHPLFFTFVGLIFSLGFGPWLARRWQDHQRDREIRADLVTDMSRCIMSLVAILERQHPGSARKEAMANQSRTEKWDLDETANSVAAFDVDRCVIGTKLETYFPSTGDTEGLAERWTTFADELIRFSASPPTSEDQRKNLAEKLNQDPTVACNAANRRGTWVDDSWGKSEQLFMNEKLALLKAVREEPIVRSARPPTTFALWLFWSFIALIAAGVAWAGEDLVFQPTPKTLFIVAALAALALALVLSLIGLFSIIRSRRRSAPPTSSVAVTQSPPASPIGRS